MSTSLRTSAATFLIFFAFGTGALRSQVAGYHEVTVSSDRGPRIGSADSRLADARLSPDLIEAGKMNEVYQDVVKVHLQGDYRAAAEMYQSLLIPMAEATHSDLTRNKFLFLSYRGLGNCYLAMSRFMEAEKTFHKLFEYLPVWPGMGDSGYPINFESIAMAQMGEQRWKAAEESLQTALTIFDDQIASASADASNPPQKERANRLRMSQDMALKLFAVVYFREQRYAEALELLDRAYHQGTAFGAPAEVVQQIVDDGRAVSIAAGDPTALATWSRRSPETPN